MRLITITIAFLTCTLSALSQSNTLSSGGDANATSGSISYSIGQIDYLYSSGTSGSFNQGLQQPYELFEINNLSEGVDLDLFIGPNPTSDELTIISTTSLDDNLNYSIFDAKGSVIIDQQKLYNNQKIQLATLARGEYFMEINRNSQRIKTYKLIKN